MANMSSQEPEKEEEKKEEEEINDDNGYVPNRYYVEPMTSGDEVESSVPTSDDAGAQWSPEDEATRQARRDRFYKRGRKIRKENKRLRRQLRDDLDETKRTVKRTVTM